MSTYQFNRVAPPRPISDNSETSYHVPNPATEHIDRTTKQQRAIAYRKAFPDMTLKEIGDAVGYTRERIRQILAKENLSTRSRGRTPKPKPLCQGCSEPVPRRRMLYCSAECRNPNGKTTFTCANCNTNVTVMTSVYKSRLSKSSKIYCGRTCRDKGRSVKPIIEISKSKIYPILHIATDLEKR